MTSVPNDSYDTIVALSSGKLPSGVAVIRVSGPACTVLAKELFDRDLMGSTPVLRKVLTADGEIIDEALVLNFPNGKSFTGEDTIEIQGHGGTAVVSAILDRLCEFEGVRLAEAGEFTRRAFENGRLDLTAVDGISDLISSETETQRRLAINQQQGSLRQTYENWRRDLIRIRALIEAEFDFSDEEDVPTDISSEGFERLTEFCESLRSYLEDERVGEIIRDGFQISIMGKPNAGKSSLINALAKRDIAIVSDEEGTTRDILEVSLDIDGVKVCLFDTAGIRESEQSIEKEGIRRAQTRADESDLVLWLTRMDEDDDIGYTGETSVLRVISQDDELSCSTGSISVVHPDGLEWLTKQLAQRVSKFSNVSEAPLITRKRYRVLLEQAYEVLVEAMDDGLSSELRAEHVRLATDLIGRITGKIDVEDLLDVIFSEFCVGK